MKLLFNTKDVMMMLSVDVECFGQLLKTGMLPPPIGFKTPEAITPNDILLWTHSDLEDCVRKLDEQRTVELQEAERKRNASD